MRGWIVGVALVGAGCGAAPDHLHGAPPLPSAARVLNGPTTPWEPSAAEVVGGRLWVADDKHGQIVPFKLPLQAVNDPDGPAIELPTQAKKLEALAATADGKGLIAWEVIGGQVVRCPTPEGCNTGPVSTPAVKAAARGLAEGEDRDVEYVNLEGMARRGDRLYFGVRQYRRKAGGVDIPWSVILTDEGLPVGFGAPRPFIDAQGRAYGISSLAVDGDHLWVVWSFEAEGAARSDVRGYLTRAPIQPDGTLWPLQRCRALPDGKPEGLAVWGEKLVVVFDNDRDRKGPAAPEKFRLNPNQDFVEIIDKPECDLGPAF